MSHKSFSFYPALISQFASVILLFVFTYTSTSKLIDHSFFQVQLQHLPWLENISGIASWVIPIAEMIVVALLLFPGTRFSGLCISLLLLFVFTIYLFIMISTQSDLPCSCGGVIALLNWKQHIILNLGLMLITGLAIMIEKFRIQVKPDPVL